MSRHLTPETLVHIAGLSQVPSAPQDSVLLMIDGQREYTSGRLPLVGIDAAVEEGARLLALARSAGMPVFHAIHHGRPGAALFEPSGDGARFIDSLAAIPGENVLVKSLPNAFAGTELGTRIRATGRRAIVIAGFATHMCVSATARVALDEGFRCRTMVSVRRSHQTGIPRPREWNNAEFADSADFAENSKRAAMPLLKGRCRSSFSGFRAL